MTPPAMIFAAGFGKRMGTLTKDIPKPMVPLAGRPMIDHAIDMVRSAGIELIVANTHYLNDAIEPHLKAQDIRISHECGEILETGGGLKAALPMLGSDVVLTLNPDAAWTGPNPIVHLMNSWRSDMHALLLLAPLESAFTNRENGDFSLDQGEIHRKGDYLYTGAQIIRTARLSEIEDVSFSLNRYWDLLAEQSPLNGVVHEGGWCDIGSPDGLKSAEKMLGYV